MTASRGTAPAERPFVTLNVAESADGKLAPIDGGKINFGSAEDRAQMEALRALADGVLIGAGTLRAEDPPLIIRDSAVRDRRTVAKGSPHPRNIAVCSILPENLAGMNFFRSPDTEKLVFTTDRTPASPCARLPAGTPGSRSFPWKARDASTWLRPCADSRRWGCPTSCWKAAAS